MLKKIKIAIVVMLCVMLVLPLSAQPVQAKNVSKKSVTITLNSKKPFKTYKFSLEKGAKVKISVKFLSVSGKAKDKENPFAYEETNIGIGAIFFLKPGDFKKNKTITGVLTDGYYDGYYVDWGTVEFALPKGIKSMKMKVTFKSTDGKK